MIRTNEEWANTESAKTLFDAPDEANLIVDAEILIGKRIVGGESVVMTAQDLKKKILQTYAVFHIKELY